MVASPSGTLVSASTGLEEGLGLAMVSDVDFFTSTTHQSEQNNSSCPLKSLSRTVRYLRNPSMPKTVGVERLT